MNVHSIRFKLTALFTGIITVLIFLLFILNSTMAENFYLSVKRKQMLSGYEEINKQVCAYSDGIITKSQMEDNLEYYTSANGMSILITNSDWTTLYTNNKGEPFESAHPLFYKIRNQYLSRIGRQQRQNLRSNIG